MNKTEIHGWKPIYRPLRIIIKEFILFSIIFLILLALLWIIPKKYQDVFFIPTNSFPLIRLILTLISLIFFLYLVADTIRKNKKSKKYHSYYSRVVNDDINLNILIGQYNLDFVGKVDSITGHGRINKYQMGKYNIFLDKRSFPFSFSVIFVGPIVSDYDYEILKNVNDILFRKGR